SSLAAYMRKQFGERPEPWLELRGDVVSSLDDVPTAAPERAQSWTELPRSDAVRMSGAIPRVSGPIGAVGDASGPATSPRESSQRLASEPSMLTPLPTDSKMGWESQQPRVPQARGTPAKLALIFAPVIALLGVAVWRLAGTGEPRSPVAAVAPSSA